MQAKYDLYRQAQQFGNDASFVANVIFCHHSKPASKLKGMVKLLNRGCQIKTGPEIDILMIDGASKPWTYLEKV